MFADEQASTRSMHACSPTNKPARGRCMHVRRRTSQHEADARMQKRRACVHAGRAGAEPIPRVRRSSLRPAIPATYANLLYHGDRSSDRVQGLRQAVTSIISVRHRAFVRRPGSGSVTDKRKPVQGIVGERGNFVAAVCELHHVPDAVILRALDVEQGSSTVP